MLLLPTAKSFLPLVYVLDDFHELFSSYVPAKSAASAACNEDDQKQCCHHSNSECAYRIPMQGAEGDSSRIVQCDLINWQGHCRSQSTHSCCYEPMPKPCSQDHYSNAD